MQAFLSSHRRALVELPRDHGKSVQACVRVLWELGRCPALRVKIVCASEALAAERGRFLRDAVARNPGVRLVFPGLRPGRPWTVNRFAVARPAEVIGPSVTALGIGAASTGTRADLLVCDDLVDVRAMHSPAERERVKRYFRENLVNLLEPDGRLWNLFTPWHRDDLNAGLAKNPVYARFRRAVGDDLTPVWPEVWPRERLQERLSEIGPVSFARGYRLTTLSGDEVTIRPEWVQFWDKPVEYEVVVLAIDPALSLKASADFTAVVALGRTADVVHCLEAVARRVAAPELPELIAAADRRWRPAVILFESNAAFDGLRQLLARRPDYGAKVRPVVQTRDKGLRVTLFGIEVQHGRFLLKAGPLGVEAAQQPLYDQMTSFPLGEHDDLLDAAAFGTAFLLGQPDPRVWAV